MKYPIYSWLIAAVLGLTVLPAKADLKIAVVNYGQLLQQSPQAQAADESVRNEFAPKLRELQNQQQALKTKEEKYQKDSATMTADQRSRAEKDLRDGYRELQRRQAEIQDDVNARRNEEVSKLQRALIEEVRTFAKAQSYDLVLTDSAAIYYTQVLDITPNILAALKARNGAAKP
ncbi:MAG: OmpH family outer membrane protein [Steroidobacteraceae bacterium]